MLQEPSQIFGKKVKLLSFFKLKPLQLKLLKGLIGKLLMIPSFFFFFQAIYPIYLYPWILGYPLIYFMLTVFDWLMLILMMTGATVIELIINTPDLLKKIRSVKFERGTTRRPNEKREPSKGESSSEGKERKEEKLELF
jgi:hypothetical protein